VRFSGKPRLAVASGCVLRSMRNAVAITHSDGVIIDANESWAAAERKHDPGRLDGVARRVNYLQHQRANAAEHHRGATARRARVSARRSAKTVRDGGRVRTAGAADSARATAPTTLPKWMSSSRISPLTAAVREACCANFGAGLPMGTRHQ
jgi:hypothetical protein